MPLRPWMTRKQRDAYEAVLGHVARSGLRVGDQLESYAELARRLRISVTLLQRVIPVLVRDGYLSVVRRVGTFVARLPPAGAEAGGLGGVRSSARAGGGAQALRVFAAESGRWARELWRKIVSAFEEEHPGIRVQFSMSVEEMGPVAGADVVVVDSHRAQRMADSLEELPSEGWPAVSGLLEPLADSLARTRRRMFWPVMFSGTVLYANRRLLAGARMFEPESWRTPMGVAETSERYLGSARSRAEGLMGWALHDVWAPLFYMGFGRSRMDAVREELESYVRLVAEAPPPRLVTLADASDESFVLELLRRGNSLFVTGYFWQRPFAEAATWAILPPPLRQDGVPLLGVMVAGVRKGAARPEEAVAFARFLAARRAQDIISGSSGLLPTDRTAARRHELWDLYARQISGGWLREALDPEAFRSSRAMEIALGLADVRTRGADPAEFVARVLAYEPGSEFTVVRCRRSG